ncbi:hypothetical protein AOZ06_08555 [Kibdelosporangium phytohabitans]|uniref:Uncharacterized protein n=1 Tax=Kibdelosporangium phytohabitans TaxID=860235 RepID=A0A0N9HXK8_9PSEU|nr:hypothetical protein AOZ06_08555 [Kibdelosporangium phytohabitans]
MVAVLAIRSLPARSFFATVSCDSRDGGAATGRTSLGRTVITTTITTGPARTQGLFSHPYTYESHEPCDPVGADHRTLRANLFRDPFDRPIAHRAHQESH